MKQPELNPDKSILNHPRPSAQIRSITSLQVPKTKWVKKHSIRNCWWINLSLRSRTCTDSSRLPEIRKMCGHWGQTGPPNKSHTLKPQEDSNLKEVARSLLSISDQKRLFKEAKLARWPERALRVLHHQRSTNKSKLVNNCRILCKIATNQM